MADTIVLRNTLRRPLTFHVAGSTVRLAPGESVDVPAKWLANADLQRFTGSGLIVNESSVRQPARDEGRAEERAKEPAKEKPASKPSTTGKQKPAKPEN
jgi:hypothetical protein